MYMPVSLCGFVLMRAGTQGAQKRGLGAVVSHATWMLGITPRVCPRAVQTLNCCAVSPAPNPNPQFLRNWMMLCTKLSA